MTIDADDGGPIQKKSAVSRRIHRVRQGTDGTQLDSGHSGQTPMVISFQEQMSRM